MIKSLGLGELSESSDRIEKLHTIEKVESFTSKGLLVKFFSALNSLRLKPTHLCKLVSLKLQNLLAQK